MNWEAVGAIGQVLGSVAVFVTLAYLATQVRQARRQMQRAATDNRAATVRQLTLTQLTNERLMGIFEKVTPRGPEFDALAEHVGLAYEEANTWFTWQTVWFQYRAATISSRPYQEKTVETTRARMLVLSGGGGFGRYPYSETARQDRPHPLSEKVV